MRGTTNGYASFFIAPDGSKEGWSTSDAADEARDALIRWMRAEDVYVDWCHVIFGGDDYDRALVVDHGGADTEETE